MVKIGISKAEPDLWTRIEEGVYSTFSIGGFLLDYEYKELDNGDFVGIIKDMETVEVSVAGIPANINAQFGVTMKSAIKKQIELDNQAKVQKERIEKIMTDNVETEQTEPEVNPLTKQINEMKELVKAQVELQKAQMELQMAKMQADAVVLPDINKGGIAPVVEQEIPEPEVIKFGSMEEERNFDLVQLKRLMTSGQDLDIIVQG